MIKDITIGQFFPGKSIVHKLDARTKIILTILYLVIIFIFCKNFYSLGFMMVFAVISYLFSRIKVKVILKSLKPLLPIILLTTILQLYYVKDGNEVLSGFITITDKGIYMAIFIALRIIGLLVVSSLLTYTTAPTDLTDAIEKLLSPLKIFKVDVHTFAMMMTIALRFIPTLVDEIDRIMLAQKARGANFESGSILKRVKALFPIFIPLFISAFKRAFELADAMSCRCYTGGSGRTRLRQMKFTWRDILCSVITVGVCGGSIAFSYIFERLI